MPRIPAGLIKQFLKKAPQITEEQALSHEDMLRKMKSGIPDTQEVESIINKTSPGAEVQKEVPNLIPESVTSPDEVRPEFQGLSKDKRKALIDQYSQPDPENPFKGPEGINVNAKPEAAPTPVQLPEDDEGALNTIMKLMQEAKNKKKK